MIYRRPNPEEAIDQEDIIDGCPILHLANFDVDRLMDPLDLNHRLARVVVLTQTCDLANRNLLHAFVAVALEAKQLVTDGILKTADIRGPIRGGRAFGWYFLPRNDELGLPESIVDFRQLHTIRLDLLAALCQRGRRRARIHPCIASILPNILPIPTAALGCRSRTQRTNETIRN